MEPDAQEKKPSCWAGLISGLETMTGFDLDGDGKVEVNLNVPEYDPNTSEVHMIITTIEGGHNSGKTYSHRLPETDVLEWMDKLTNTVKESKTAEASRLLHEEFGHSQYSMLRAKTNHMYNSNTFQYGTAFLIMSAFVLDICESQLLPVDGSESESTFFALYVVLTGFVMVEILINIFAHSNNGFQPFYSRGSNWFDTTIVIVSIVNVIFTASGVDLPNAKLLRLLRLGRYCLSLCCSVPQCVLQCAIVCCISIFVLINLILAGLFCRNVL